MPSAFCHLLMNIGVIEPVEFCFFAYLITERDSHGIAFHQTNVIENIRYIPKLRSDIL